ncbi:MAG: YggT family protein [Bellilinea sp.]
MTDYKEVRTTAHEQGSEGRVTTFKVTQLIWLLVGLLEGVLALRFIFKLVGVNAANAFASLLYAFTDFFVAPFASLTGAPAAGGMVLEVSTLIAMIVYALIGWALVKIVYVLFYRPRGPVSTRQTVVAEHTPPQGVSQTRTTTTQAPSAESQTTTTEHTNTL